MQHIGRFRSEADIGGTERYVGAALAVICRSKRAKPKQ